MGRVYRDQRLGLNSYVLEYKADQIYEAVNKGMMPGEKSLLKDLLQRKGSGNPKRNFFAHARLIADYTYVRRTEDGDVVLEYDANRLKEIISCIRDP
jgi:CRISPR/Cas system-associated protein Csx1